MSLAVSLVSLCRRAQVARFHTGWTTRGQVNSDWNAGPMPAELLISIPEAGRRLGLGRSSAYDLVYRGELGSVRVGGRRLVPLAELERYVDQLCVDAGLQRAASPA